VEVGGIAWLAPRSKAGGWQSGGRAVLVGGAGVIGSG
jgi:hypothetical protein